MITLITGLPGNGKTLFALWYIKKYAQAENRDVYYSGIKDLMLPWTESEPEKWMTLPAGAIIVIDEAQFVFPKKPNGSKLPDFYEKLATHRHNGFDIFVITQHPSLVDNFVRKLVGRHMHAVRKFGMARNTIYEWSAANEGPEKVASQKNAIVLKWKFPAEVYGYYKSAEVHTVKRSIPAKLVLAVLFVVAVVAGGYYTLQRYQDRTHKPKASEGMQAGVDGTGGVSGGLAGKGVPFDPVADAKQFIAMSTPRVVGLEYTAPKYDERTKPTSVPVPVMCIQHGPQGNKCKCFSQQATPLDVPFNMCLTIARNGFFQEFNPDREANGGQRLAGNARVEVATDKRSGAGPGDQVMILTVPPAQPAKKPLDGNLGNL